MDDTGETLPHLGLDQEDHPAVPLGDDRLLEDVVALHPPHGAVQAVRQALVGGPGLRSQFPQGGAGAVQHFAGPAYRLGKLLLHIHYDRQVSGNAAQDGHLCLAEDGSPGLAGDPEGVVHPP